jgi:hypothetical protein
VQRDLLGHVEVKTPARATARAAALYVTGHRVLAAAFALLVVVNSLLVRL